MENTQGDEEVLQKLLTYLEREFPKLKFKTKVQLKELFCEPQSKYLKSFWRNRSHADIAVFRHCKLVCIIEPGGYSHFKDKKQQVRDEKKDKICRQNGVNCLRVTNSFVDYLNKKVSKKLLKKYFYGLVWCGKVW